MGIPQKFIRGVKRTRIRRTWLLFARLDDAA